jgi:hypothetical protein
MLEHFLFKKLHNRNVVTLNVLPSPIPTPLHAHLPLLEQCCRSSSDSLFMSSVTFAFTACTDSNLVPFNADLISGNKEKSHGAGSGEYGACSNTVTLCFVKNVLTDRQTDRQTALCAGALSCWRTHQPSFHMSGLLLLLTRSRRFVRTPLQ